ncbi:lipoprotein NlpI [Vibrio scophthalmi]|uniref:Lipoprotein NlpI n=2 Tax=Vibrio scophthalmi TaxID=45658 RepID=A0A1C7F7T4_9VIBR|nr:MULTISPECIES: lipoprotein NlpI [Vibrio]ANU35463.1 Lipoprotein NlpI [Vibrio scophthalmi]EGU32155.1 lipoprotein NlpI [Vibrio scophthalmi LMG 19158]EGU34856.1 lipoprotein NlpI [Vibrio sp. N418]MCY9805618.1 lipoprotein NlpI [Vibrio scophthalmi]ODS10317.1 Lipoprotein NlpI [Vibrio scophthalmi]
MKWFQTLTLGLSILVATGCTSTSNQQWVYPPMAVPLQASMQQEVQIARLSQLLKRPDLSEELRAKMLFERGNYYDSVGLRDLARLDYSQSLQLNPSQPDLFNLLGVYYTQVGEFDAAYEAFDSTLDLDPENSYAVRNRAIALYYGDRIELAIEDIDAHFAEEPSDPFRALWVYLIKLEQTPEAARQTLLEQYQQRDSQWGWVLVAITLGEVSEEQAFKAIIAGTRDNTLLAQRLTEAYFYLGKRYQHQGDFAGAISMYKLAISFNVYEYVEHRYSFLELTRIFTQVKAEQLAKAKLEEAAQP